MNKNIVWLSFLCFIGLVLNTQGQTFTETYVYRTSTTVEKVVVETDVNQSVINISYQGNQDKSPVKLTIVKKDAENMRMTTQRPDNKQILTFTDSWMMGGSMILANGQTKEFSREVYCFAPSGEMIITSGGPMFMPFYYAPSEKGLITPINIPQEQHNNIQTLPSGEVYYVVNIPKKVGKYKLSPMNYKENDLRTRIKLIDSKGKATIFTSR
ncbi:MAG: hypothetical protein MUC49_08465 [Raineya sp.]|jgi:hypothetical protein|nr:hypothetical protein [Raineya sp.]